LTHTFCGLLEQQIARPLVIDWGAEEIGFHVAARLTPGLAADPAFLAVGADLGATFDRLATLPAPTGGPRIPKRRAAGATGRTAHQQHHPAHSRDPPHHHQT
jgi:hypothetical protein